MHLYEARKNNRDLDEIMVVEGYMDVIAWPSKACATRWRPWHGDQRGTSSACSAWCPACRSASTATPPGARRPGAPGSHPAQPADAAAHASCSCPKAKTRHPGTQRRHRCLHAPASTSTPSRWPTTASSSSAKKPTHASLEGKAHLVTLAAPLIDKIPGNHLARPDAPAPVGKSPAVRRDANRSRRAPRHARRQRPAAVDEPPADYGHDAPTRVRRRCRLCQPYRNRPKLYEQKKPWQKGEGKSWKKRWRGKRGRLEQGPARQRPAAQAGASNRRRADRPRAPCCTTCNWRRRSRMSAISPMKTTLYAQLLVALVGTLQKSPAICRCN